MTLNTLWQIFQISIVVYLPKLITHATDQKGHIMQVVTLIGFVVFLHNT